MKITDLQLNHKKDPLGYAFPRLRFQWQIEEAQAPADTVRLWVWDQESCVFDSGETAPGSFDGMEVSLALAPRRRYDWQVQVTLADGSRGESEKAWFETAKQDEPWEAPWLSLPTTAPSASVFRDVMIKAPLKEARLYICGYGVYEVFVDGRKAGEEYLQPGFDTYDLRQEYQTLDLTACLTPGSHRLKILLGNGWYRGRLVFEGGFEDLYGDCLKASAELDLTYADGTSARILTDESWQAQTSEIGENNIYDGEAQDYHLAGQPLDLQVSSPAEQPVARSSMPILETARIFPVAVLHTPAGETVLDFGEMVTGWVTFYCREEKDTKIRLQYGELLQDGNFYRENLRTAKAQFTYVSEGEEKWIRPHFTYYGFRYVRLEGITRVCPEDFQAVRLMSYCGEGGTLQTGNELVNRLIANSRASQDCNFLSIPTDCPQRDERMGWTGDIAVFADTACLNRDCAGFLTNYTKMIGLEESAHDGAVPLFVPAPKGEEIQRATDVMIRHIADGTAGWGDAAVDIPWALYENYRDVGLLRQQYPVMKTWIDFVHRQTLTSEIPYLWLNGYQLGDWLALDENGQSREDCCGFTDTGFLASARYYHSLDLCRQAVEILSASSANAGERSGSGRQEYAEDLAFYETEMKAVRTAITETYLQEDGTVKIPETQTAYAVLLAWHLGEPQTAVDRLVALIHAQDDHLRTGFLGTPLLCPVLSANGAHETACQVFLQETYPGWLHEVKLGAVTIWERWNSLDEDGHVSGTGMNSMNHYAYGSIVSWMYRYLCGFQNDLSTERSMRIRPLPCEELGWMKGSVRTSWGIYTCRWQVSGPDEAVYQITVPEGGTAEVTLPGAAPVRLEAGIHELTGRIHE